MTLFKPQEKVQFEKYMGNRTFDIFLEEKMALSQNNLVSHHILHIIIWLNFFYQIFFNACLFVSWVSVSMPLLNVGRVGLQKN